jgi:hypothetical protein
LPTIDDYVAFINNSRHKFNLAEHPDTTFNNAAVKAMIPHCIAYIKGNYLGRSFPDDLLKEEVLTSVLKALIFSMAQRVSTYKTRVQWSNDKAMNLRIRRRRHARRQSVRYQPIVCET